jgi:hypothetical protein
MILFRSSFRLQWACLAIECLAILLMTGGRFAFAQAYGPPSSNSFYSLRWNADFSQSGGGPSSATDSRNWMWLMGVAPYSTQLTANTSQDSSGYLDIADTKAASGSPNTTGGVISQSVFRFGYFQVNAWTPSSGGGWLTAFSLSGGANSVESWNRRSQPASFTEIDGFQIDSASPAQTEPGIISWTGSSHTTSLCNGGPMSIYNTTQPTPPGAPIDSSAGWHTYGIEWTEANVTYYVDNYPLCSQPYSATTNASSPVNMLLTSVANTGAVVGSGTAQFADPRYYVQDYYVNPEDTGYAEYGSWGGSSVAGFSSQPIRYSCSSGASVVYTPNLLAAGTYDVQVYAIVYSSTQDTATAVTINDASGAVTAASLPSTGVSRWVDEGTYSFNADSSSSVMLQRTNNCLRTSMVKFVRKS